MFNILFPHPAALIKTGQKTSLVIADPHLGWELSLQQKGIHVPSQTQKLFKKLVALLDQYRPAELIVLGDVKYTVVVSEPGEWRDIPNFFEELKDYVKEIRIVRGNHDANLDPMLPESVQMLPATGVVVGDVGLFHGHKWPSPVLLKCKTLLMGHLHPVVVFRDPAGFKLTRQAWMRIDCDALGLAKILLQKQGIKIEDTVEKTLQGHFDVKSRTVQMYVMPSFNDFLGGRAVNESPTSKDSDSDGLIGPVLRSKAVDVAGAELYLLDGTFLGTLTHLRAFG